MLCHAALATLLTGCDCIVAHACSEGIEILDGPNGKVVGRSVTAGKWALAQVAATRIALPLPSTCPCLVRCTTAYQRLTALLVCRSCSSHAAAVHHPRGAQAEARRCTPVAEAACGAR